MSRAAAVLLVCLLVVGGVACGPAPAGEDARAHDHELLPRAATPVVAGRPVVIVLGDSISAGKDLAKAQAWPALVARQLEREGRGVRMINASESGITSRAGVERLDWLLAQEPGVLVVELGANDGLRGQPLASVAQNLRQILERSRAAGAVPLLLGMELPPNYGPAYTAGFAQLYADLADEFDAAFVPFFMESVAGDPELNLADGLHPNAAGHERLAEALLPAFRILLDELSGA